MIVGRSTDDVLVATLDDEQMAILDATDELDTLATLLLVDGLGESLVEIIDEYAGILRLEVTTIVGDNLAILESDDIAADSEVIGLHLVTNRSCFQRTASFIDLVEVIAQDGGVGYLGPRGKTLGNGNQTACSACLCQAVHVFRTCILQKGFSAKAVDLMVGHAVA